MGTFMHWGAALLSPLAATLALIIMFTPKLLGFLVILLVGWIVAATIARGVTYLLLRSGFERMASRSGLARLEQEMGIRMNPAKLLGRIVYWFVFLVFVLTAVNALGLPAISALLYRIVAYIPNVFVAVLVLLVGMLVAAFVVALLHGALAQGRFGNPNIIANIARYAIIGFATLVALYQLQIAPALIETLFTVTIGAVALAFGLAFGLGGRDTAKRYLERSEGAISGAGAMLNPALARGELRCIGATTLDEYRKNTEKDTALERYFQPIQVGEPSIAEPIAMLQIVRPNDEVHHDVSITDDAIDVSDRFLPDKAIDVMDEASSAQRLEETEKDIVSPTLISDLEKELAAIQSKKEASASVEDYEQAAKLRQQELVTLDQLEKVHAQGANMMALMVTPEHGAHIVETWTDVPVSQMREGERQNLRNLEEDLHKRVIGQDEAISAVSRAIRRSRAGLKDPKRPIGSFLFLGPTGVGKTELARSLAAELFGGEENLIRLDMSEYMEPHTASRLFGSPAGYVGDDEGGLLTEQVRRRPYSVILLDEVEKAHPEVFNSLLQIMDDGRLTDGQGRSVDFKNTIMIMTSNAGSADLKRALRIGFSARKDGNERDEQREVMRPKALEGLKRVFRPELINRIDQIVVFHTLGREELYRIVDLLLNQVRSRLSEQGVELEVSDEARDFLLQEGFDEEYGARPLRRAIQTYVEDALADALLADGIASGQKALLQVAGDGIVVVAQEVAQPQNA